MGWALMILFAALVLVLLWLVARIGKQGLELAAAAMLLAIAGYAWWGSPSQAGAPAAARDTRVKQMSAEDIRKMEKDQFSSDGNVMMLTDALIRAGATRQAVDLFADAVKSDPQNADLWVGMGNALVIHGGGMMNPSAEFAFDQAARISPNHPGPPFFLGLALAQSGKLDEAGEVWRALLARAPEGADWVPDLKQRLEQIGQAGQPAQAAAGAASN